jgi:thiamine biosynthesis lipoprotein
MSREARLVFDAMATRCELAGRGRAACRLATGREWIDTVARRLTRFEPESELMRLNARAGHGRPLREGQTSLLTRPAPPPPLPEMLAVRPGAARLSGGTALDLGGVAKGWMADTLAELLGDDCVVNLGGDLFARGRWTVGFGGQTVVLDGLGAATSGSWRRRWGDGLHHVIDPRTAGPATGDLCQVSVIAPTASIAETLAKTALIQGREAGEAWLRGRALGYAFA